MQLALVLLISADSLPPVAEELDPRRCGLYCLEAAALASACDPNAAEAALANAVPPYSLGELKQAAEALGLDAEIVAAANPASFPLAGGPAILHLPPKSGDAEGHFVVSTGEDRRGRVAIVNYPSDAALASREDLAEKWGWQGTALLIGKPGAEPIERIRWERRWRMAGRWLGYLLVAMGLAGVVRQWRKTRTKAQSAS